MSEQEEKITYSIVPEQEREDFIYKQLRGLGDYGVVMLRFENTIYGFMDRLSEDYNGGYWEFAKLSNGGFFMYPDSGADKKYKMFSPNGTDAELSPMAAGIVACLFAFSDMSFDFQKIDQDGVIADMYWSLRNYASEIPEASDIYALID